MVFGFLSRMLGSGPAKPAHVATAEGCFSKEELQAIKDHFQAALQGNAVQVLDVDAFSQLLCGLPSHRRGSHAGTSSCLHEPGLIGIALYNACRGCGAAKEQDQAAPAAPATAGVSLDDVIVAKAACERMPTSDSHTFAFKLLCHLAAAATPASTAAAPASASDHAAEKPFQQKHVGDSQAAQSYMDTGIPLTALEQGLSAICALLNVHGQLTGSSNQTCDDSKVSDAGKNVPYAGNNQPAHDAASTQQDDTQRQASFDVLHSWVAAAARGAMWTAAGPASNQPASSLTMDGYARWNKAMPIWDAVLTSSLSEVGKQRAVGTPADVAGQAHGKAAAAAGLLVPAPLLPKPPRLLTSTASAGDVRAAASPANLLLHPLAALLLAGCMPLAQREEWQLLFNSDRDGKSFNTLMGRLSTVEGATLMLVKEAGDDGHLVAGYAPVAWRKNGSYYGDHTTWVARLQPDLQVYTATGLNTNFQWCGVGFSQLTNGLGFGGAQGTIPAFALLVDATLDNGQSRPIATFGSPSLTRSQQFTVSTVECWLVQRPEEDPSTGSNNNKKATSVLQKAGADRVIMGLAGMKVDHSAGIKDEPLEED